MIGHNFVQSLIFASYKKQSLLSPDRNRHSFFEQDVVYLNTYDQIIFEKSTFRSFCATPRSQITTHDCLHHRTDPGGFIVDKFVEQSKSSKFNRSARARMLREYARERSVVSIAANRQTRGGESSYTVLLVRFFVRSCPPLRFGYAPTAHRSLLSSRSRLFVSPRRSGSTSSLSSTAAVSSSSSATSARDRPIAPAASR